MSRRFGRNQRRRLRDELARMQEDSALLESEAKLCRAVMERQARLISDLFGKNTELQQELDGAKEVLGCHFIGFKPETVNLGAPFRPGMKVMLPSHTPPAWVGIDMGKGPATGNTVALDVLAVELMAAGFDPEIHARVTFADMKTFYVIRKEDLQRRGVLATSELIAKQVAKIFSEELCKIQLY